MGVLSKSRHENARQRYDSAVEKKSILNVGRVRLVANGHDCSGSCNVSSRVVSIASNINREVSSTGRRGQGAELLAAGNEARM